MYIKLYKIYTLLILGEKGEKGKEYYIERFIKNKNKKINI